MNWNKRNHQDPEHFFSCARWNLCTLSDLMLTTQSGAATWLADLWFMEWKTPNLLKKRKQPMYSWDDLKKTYIYLISVHICQCVQSDLLMYGNLIKKNHQTVSRTSNGNIKKGLNTKFFFVFCCAIIFCYCDLYLWPFVCDPVHNNKNCCPPPPCPPIRHGSKAVLFYSLLPYRAPWDSPAHLGTGALIMCHNNWCAWSPRGKSMAAHGSAIRTQIRGEILMFLQSNKSGPQPRP